MTKDIGTGTVNFTMNMPADERAFWGRVAGRLRARSVGDLKRMLCLLALQNIAPELAAELRQIRDRYYGVNLAEQFSNVRTATVEAARNLATDTRAIHAAGLLLVIGVGIAASWLTHDEMEGRRFTQRGTRGRRTEQLCGGVEVEWEG